MMTIVEVIETLKANYPDACFEQLRDAVDAAIVVLKAQDTAGDTVVSRQAVRDWLLRWEGYVDKDTIIRMQARVIDVPSAGVVPVKRGRREWRKEKTVWQTGYYCSECQTFFGKDYDMVKYFNYCPNCGAKLEGSEA